MKRKGERAKVRVKEEQVRAKVKREQEKMRMCSDLGSTTMWYRRLEDASWRATWE